MVSPRTAPVAMARAAAEAPSRVVTPPVVAAVTLCPPCPMTVPETSSYIPRKILRPGKQRRHGRDDEHQTGRPEAQREQAPGEADGDAGDGEGGQAAEPGGPVQKVDAQEAETPQHRRRQHQASPAAHGDRACGRTQCARHPRTAVDAPEPANDKACGAAIPRSRARPARSAMDRPAATPTMMPAAVSSTPNSRPAPVTGKPVMASSTEEAIARPGSSTTIPPATT